MSEQHISLTALSGRLIVYEKLPVPFSKEMQENVWRTLVVDLISIFFFAIVPRLLLSAVYTGFFSPMGLLFFPAEILEGMSALLQSLIVVLLPTTMISLLLTGAVLITSAGFSRAVHESVHWMAFLASIPAWISVVVVGVTIITSTILTAITVVIWVVLIVIGILLGIAAVIFIIGFLGVMGGA